MAVLVRKLKVMDLPRLEAIEAAQVSSYPSRPRWLQSFRRLVELTLRDEP